MQNITWKGIRLRIESHNVFVNGNQLELRRCYRNATGTPILMLAGFLENSQVFLPDRSEAGLAQFLAAQGYDVYLADLRGKGNSWPKVGRHSDWGLHEAIVEDIPAHLGMLEKLRPGVAQFWLGQGMGSILLLCAYARLQQLSAPVLGMAHFAASRQCQLDSWRKLMGFRLWSGTSAVYSFLNGYVGIPFSESIKRETRLSLSVWKRWLNGEDWRDPVDKFNYGDALQATKLPANAYFANLHAGLWGNADDCRHWIEEMGQHDARLFTVGKSGGSQRNYSSKGLLQHPTSCEDHFQQLNDWLKERELLITAKQGDKEEDTDDLLV